MSHNHRKQHAAASLALALGLCAGAAWPDRAAASQALAKKYKFRPPLEPQD